jgi:hypothetical protein
MINSVQFSIIMKHFFHELILIWMVNSVLRYNAIVSIIFYSNKVYISLFLKKVQFHKNYPPNSQPYKRVDVIYGVNLGVQ